MKRDGKRSFVPSLARRRIHSHTKVDPFASRREIRELSSRVFESVRLSKQRFSRGAGCSLEGNARCTHCKSCHAPHGISVRVILDLPSEANHSLEKRNSQARFHSSNARGACDYTQHILYLASSVSPIDTITMVMQVFVTATWWIALSNFNADVR